jgi:hypothetical protein
MYRHGDVLIAEVPSIPERAKLQQSSILVRGEITGHSHRIEPYDGAKVFEEAGVFYLHVTAPQVRIVHEEHAPIALPPGFYKVWQQREYTPKAIRRVVD